MTREDLKNYFYNKKWIDSQLEKYLEQKQRAEGLKAVVLDGMPKGHNTPNYAIEELLDRYDELIAYCNKEQEKLNEINKQLLNMENSQYRLILTYRYVNGKSLGWIADELSYDYYEICKRHGLALEEFDKLDEKIELHKKTQENTN
jgi:hypothetical protein